MAYIVTEGVIGVGKTTLARLLSERLGLPVLFEEFEENPFLSKFYIDKARYGFQTEVFFLLNRYKHQQDIVRRAVARGNLVADYMFGKTSLFASMNLECDELALFRRPGKVTSGR